MAQSYVGKHAISKGIGRAIRKFVAFAFSAHVLGHRRRACAVPDIQKRASHLVRGTLRSVFPAADAICWKTITWEIQKLRKLVQCCNGKVGRQPPAWLGGEEAARRRPLWQHATRRQGGARPVCLTQDWIGPTGDTSKQRFGSTKLKV
jgi:hypothetical protein